MELACKARIDDEHGRTRIEWQVSGAGLPTAPADFAAPSAHFDLSDLDKLPPPRAVRVMLRSAAEIEHQLFLQYLYASCSLKDSRAARIVGDIAVEEMGHLLTVNNLLVAMDGDPYFGRGPDTPAAGSGDPFAFELRAASRTTLAIFTAAESPDPEVLESWWTRRELRKIFDEADASLQWGRVQRVGALYQKIVRMMKSEPVLDADFASAAQYLPIQAAPTEAWTFAGVSRHMIVERITNRHEAIHALEKIMTQGEGPLNDDDSHFVRYRRLYRGMRLPRMFPQAFPALLAPEDGSKAWLHALWCALGLYSPAFDPLEPGAPADLATPSPVSKTLAQLLDARYQLLLVRLYQIFTPNPATARRVRIDCALREMRFVIAPLTDSIRRAVAAGGGCPPLYALPPYFDPHTGPKQQTLQADLLHETDRRVRELQLGQELRPGQQVTAPAYDFGSLGSIAAAIQDLESVLATLPERGV